MRAIRLVEQFEIENESVLPLLWAEFADGSAMPSYNATRVVACVGSGRYRWPHKSVSPRRGSYQLGPARLTWSDPFGLFGATQEIAEMETVLIYPRVPICRNLRCRLAAAAAHDSGDDRLRLRSSRRAFARIVGR